MSENFDDDAAKRHLKAVATVATRLDTNTFDGGVVWYAWGAGPPVVLLHGGSGSWNHWIHTIPFLSDGYRVLAADIPGLGDSPTPHEPHSIEKVATIISDGIDQLIPNETAFDLVGFSFGGLVGGQIAIRQARRISRLIIVGSPPFGLGHVNPAHDITPFKSAWTFAQALPVHRNNLEILMIANPAKVDALAIRIHHDNLCRSRLRTRKLARTNSLHKALQKTACVVHGIWGEKDVTVYPDFDTIRELFASTHPDSTFDILPDTGHWAAYENPVAFNELLRRRLGDHSLANNRSTKTR